MGLRRGPVTADVTCRPVVPFAPHRHAPCRRASPVHTPRPPRPIRRDPGSVTSHLRRGDPVEPGDLGRSLPPEGLSTSWRRISLRGGTKDAASPRGEGPSPFRCSFFVTTPSPRVRGAQGDGPSSVSLLPASEGVVGEAGLPPRGDLDGACVCGPNRIPRGASQTAPPDHGGRGPGVCRRGTAAPRRSWPVPVTPGQRGSRRTWLRAPLPDLAKKFLALFSKTFTGCP